MDMELAMLRRLVAGTAFLLCIGTAFAEDTKTVQPAPESGAASTPSAITSMPQAAVGDHWTYEVRDEITGTIKATRTVVVTDISKNAISTRFDIAQTGRFGVTLYDTSWNIINTDGWRYSPNDGTGIRLPLTPDTQWKVTADATNLTNGRIFKRTGNSRVTGQETITTKAGKFDTAVFETKYLSRDTKDPTRSTDITNRTWYNTDINHWVKRTLVVRKSGHLVLNEVTELTEYGRRQQES
jgi:hypothetical protein